MSASLSPRSSRRRPLTGIPICIASGRTPGSFPPSAHLPAGPQCGQGIQNDVAEVRQHRLDHHDRRTDFSGRRSRPFVFEPAAFAAHWTRQISAGPVHATGHLTDRGSVVNKVGQGLRDTIECITDSFEWAFMHDWFPWYLFSRNSCARLPTKGAGVWLSFSSSLPQLKGFRWTKPLKAP
jgi:hypothetical protein